MCFFPKAAVVVKSYFRLISMSSPCFCKWEGWNSPVTCKHGECKSIISKHWHIIVLCSLSWSNAIWCTNLQMAVFLAEIKACCWKEMEAKINNDNTWNHTQPILAVIFVLAANLCGVSGRIQDQRWTGSVSVLTCISQEVSGNKMENIMRQMYLNNLASWEMYLFLYIILIVENYLWRKMPFLGS